MKKLFFLGISLATILLSCKQENNSAENKTASSSDQNVWAEQIEANTSLVKPEGWAEEDWKAVNKNVDHQKIFNTLAEAVTSGKQKAYDFFTDSLYTTEQIKERLSTITAANISAIRTRETWNFDKENFKLEKKVSRIYLFTQKLDENGEYLGDKALFYVKLND
jgi:hypothetical protein